MSLYNTYNSEDILSRAVIAGMLDVLNNKIVYNQVWSNEEIEQIKIPWFYNMSGDERFMQDFYTHYSYCNFPKPVDGNFDQIPRGVITYTGSPIDANRITNRFVQGRYVKLVNNKLQSFVSFLYSIPLTINFDCELWIDTQVTALKVEQAIREEFYKTKTFYVYYKGMRLGCTAGFPEQIITDKQIEYTFNDDNRIKMNFSLEVESYQPVFDKTTEMDANNYMRGIGYRLYGENTDGTEEKNDGKIEKIEVRLPQELDISTGDYPITNIVPKGYPLLLEWQYSKELYIMNKVDIYWKTAGESEDWNLIEKGVDNNEFWYWNISESFTNFNSPSIIYDENDSINIYRQPTIVVLPDISSGKISSDSFKIINGGYFMVDKLETSIGIILEMKDDQGRTYYTEDNQIFLNLNHFTVNPENPIWVDPSIMAFPGTVDYKQINLIVTNSVNKEVYGESNVITII